MLNFVRWLKGHAGRLWQCGHDEGEDARGKKKTARQAADKVRI